jgi:hypothetical protein
LLLLVIKGIYRIFNIFNLKDYGQKREQGAGDTGMYRA